MKTSPSLPASKTASLLAAVHSRYVHLILGLVLALPSAHVAGEDVVLLDMAVSADFGPEERLGQVRMREISLKI